MQIFQQRAEGPAADAADEVAYQPDVRILHRLYDLSEIIMGYPDIAVADQNIRKLRCLISGDKVVDLRIQGIVPLFHHNGDLFMGIPLLYLSCQFDGRIVLFFEGEYDLIIRVCLVAEAGEIISEVVVQPLERLQDRDGGAKSRRR